MSVQVEKLENSMAKLTIEVSAEDFEKAMEHSYKKNRNQIQIAGFRKGKAPRKMIEKIYGPEVFYDDAVNFAIPDAYEKAFDEVELEIVSKPEIEVVEVESGKPLVFAATVAIRPEVELGDYKGMEVPKASVEVTDEEVKEEMDRVLEQNARMEKVEDRPVKEGDTANIDYEGFVDDEAFEGGKDEGYDLVIGSGSFIPGFEDQLIGKNIGEEVDVQVTFPEEYHAENLKGKDAVFKVKINGIREKILRDWDDEFVDEISEFSTVDEYKDSVIKTLTSRKENQARAGKENAAIEKALENMKVDLPAPMIQEQVERMVNDFASRLQSQGLNIQQYMQMTGASADSLMDEMRPEAEQRIKVRLMLEEIAKVENMEATDEDVENEMKTLADQYQMEVDKVKGFFGEEETKQMKLDILVKKAADLLVDTAVEVEVKEEEADQESKEEQ